MNNLWNRSVGPFDEAAVQSFLNFRFQFSLLIIILLH